MPRLAVILGRLDHRGQQKEDEVFECGNRVGCSLAVRHDVGLLQSLLYPVDHVGTEHTFDFVHCHVYAPGEAKRQ